VKPDFRYNERHDAGARLAVAEHSVAFPVAEAGAVLGAVGALAEMPLAGQPSATVVPPVAFAAALGRDPQVRPQRTASVLVPPNVPIDRLVADREQPAPRAPADDLLWAPVLAQQPLDHGPIRRGELGIATRDPAPMVRVRLRAHVPIETRVAPPPIAAQRPADGAGVAAEGPRHRGLALPLAAQDHQRIPFLEGDLGVRHGFLSLGGGLKPSVSQVTSLASRVVALSM